MPDFCQWSLISLMILQVHTAPFELFQYARVIFHRVSLFGISIFKNRLQVAQYCEHHITLGHYILIHEKDSLTHVEQDVILEFTARLGYVSSINVEIDMTNISVQAQIRNNEASYSDGHSNIKPCN